MAPRFIPFQSGAVIALDLETLRKATDWSEADKRSMGIACCGVEDVATTQTAVFLDTSDHHNLAGNIGNLANLQFALNRAGRIVTFGGGNQADIGFDFCVLEGAGLAVDRTRSFDLRLEIKSRCKSQGITPSGSITLGTLAQANACPEYPSLGQGKTGVGADAPSQWAAGERQAVIDYCLDDVKMTADLYRLWQSRGWLYLPDGQRVYLETTNETKNQTGENDSGAASGDAGDSGGTGGSGQRVPEPQSAAAEHVSGQSVGTGEQVASQPEPAQSVVSTNGKPVFRLLPGGFVSTNEPPKNSLQVPTQKELIASDLKSWKRLKGKPPIPDLHVVNPSGKRKIGRLFRVGYEILRRVPCQDCGKERRLTAGYISASQLIELEYEDYETKAGIIKNILRRNAAAIDGRLHDIRCSGCDSGRAGHLEAVG